MSTRTSKQWWPPGEIKCYFLNCTDLQPWHRLRTEMESAEMQHTCRKSHYYFSRINLFRLYKCSGNTGKQQNRNPLASCNRFLALKAFGALSGIKAVKSKQTQKYKKQKSWKNNMKNCQEMQIKQNKMHNRNRCKAIKKIQIPLLTNKNYA